MRKTKPLPPNAKLVFKGVIFEVWQWEQAMFDGSTSTFERLKRPGTVQTIATVDDKVLMLEEEQPDSMQKFLSLPGGRIDEGEDALTAAKRELLEETGYTSDDWVLLAEDVPIAKMEWTIYTFIARSCRKEAQPHLDAGERIASMLLSFDELIALSDDPAFRDLELTTELLRMRLDASKKEAFRKLLFGA